MADAKQQIAIFERFNYLPDQLQEVLHAKGYSSKLVASYREVFDLVEQGINSSLLIFEVGLKLPQIEKCLDELFTVPFIASLLSQPIIFAGKINTQQRKKIEANFRYAEFLELPCNGATVIETIEMLLERVEHTRQRLDSSADEKRDNIFQVDSDTLQLKLEQTYRSSVQAPRTFFDALRSGGLAKADLNGAQYLTGRINTEFLREQGYFNLDQKTLSAVQTTLSKADRWSNLHICRTTFMAQQIVQALGLESELVAYTVPAALLYCDALIGYSSELLRLNYTRPGRSLARKEICSRIKDSAMRAATEVQSAPLATLISAIGKIIGGEESWSDSEESMIASCIVVADATDRIFFKSGAWDPRAANAIMRKIKQGTFIDMHPRIACCLIKFISEAALLRPWTFLLPPHIRRNPALVEQSKRLRECIPEKSEERVELADLMPGMRLSKPLLAFDGRKILSEDLRLDEDLIWRIWQLASVRPLNAPLILVPPGKDRETVQ